MRRALLLLPTLLLTACGTASLLQTGPSMREQSITETTDAYSIDVRYPEFSGLSPESMDDVNQRIRSLVDQRIGEFRRSVAVLPETTGGTRSSLSVSYDSPFLTPRVASVLFIVSSRLRGAANPNEYRTSLTVDLDRRESIVLQDLFQNADLALPSIAQDIAPEDAGPITWDLFSVFLLGADGVTVWPSGQLQGAGGRIRSETLRPLLNQRGALLLQP